MAILFRKIQRHSDLSDSTSAMKVYPVITYQYSNPAKLKEVAQEISDISGVTEGNAYSVLKDFRTYLKKALLQGRIVNIDGLGYFYLAAQSRGTNTMAEFTSNDITGLRICFKANKDIRLDLSATTRSEGLVLKDVDKINDDEATTTGSSTTDSDTGSGSGSDTGSDSGSDSENPYDPFAS